MIKFLHQNRKSWRFFIKLVKTGRVRFIRFAPIGNPACGTVCEEIPALLYGSKKKKQRKGDTTWNRYILPYSASLFC